MERQPIQSTDNAAAKTEREPSYGDLLHFSRGWHLLWLLPLLLAALATAAVVPTQAFILGQLTQLLGSFVPGSQTATNFENDVSKWIHILVEFGAAACFLFCTSFAGWQTFGDFQVHRVYTSLFDRMLQHEIEWFDKRQDGVASLVTRTQSWTVEHRKAVSFAMATISQSVFTALLASAYALYNSWELFLMILVGVPIIAPLAWYFSTKGARPIGDQHSEMSKATKHVNNALSSIETIKCFNGQDVEHERYTLALHNAAASYSKQSFWFALQYGLLRFATVGMFVQTFWFGEYLLGKGKITAVRLLITFMSAIMAISSLMAIPPQIMVLVRGKIAAAKLRAIEEHSTVRSSKEVEEFESPFYCTGSFDVVHIDFAYPTRPDQLVLREFTLQTGSFTFIIGKSGCGKSTIGQLLTRLYDYKENGHSYIMLDANKIDKLDPQWTRRYVLLVEQQSILFEGTIFENIAYGCLEGNATLDEVKQAADFANILEDIEAMPKGFYTQVGRKGTCLSGGQRQRIALARAWLRDPKFLILDECTSALDQRNRQALMVKIRHWRGDVSGKPTMIITHDISQIEPQDWMHIMDEGAIIESGQRRKLEANPKSAIHDFIQAPVGPVTPPRSSLNLNKSLPPTPNINIGEGDEFGSPFAAARYRRDDETDPLEEYLRRFDDDEPQYNNSMMSAALTKRASLGPFRQSMLFGPSVGSSTLVATTASRIHNPQTISDSAPRPMRQGNPRAQPDLQWFRPDPRIPPSTLRAAKSATVRGLRRFSQRMIEVVRLPHNSMTTEITQRTKKEDCGEAIPLQSLGHTLPQSQPPDGEQAESSELPKQKAVSFWRVLKTVWPILVKRYRYRLVLAALAATGYAVATPSFSIVFSKLLTMLYDEKNQSYKAATWSLIMLAIGVADGCFVSIQQWGFETTALAWVNTLRSEAYRRILIQPRDFFDKHENGTSRLMEHLDTNAELMQSILGRFVNYLFIATIMVVICVIWSFVVCWELTLILIACAPVFIGVSFGYTAMSNHFDRRIADCTEHANAIFMETFANIKTVRALSLEKKFQEKHENARAAVFRMCRFKNSVCGLLYGLSQAMMIFTTALAFLIAMRLLVKHGYTVKQIFEVLTQLLWTFSNATPLFSFIPQGSVAKEGAVRLLRLANLPLISFEIEGDTRIAQIGDIGLRSLNFSYPTEVDHLVLRNLNLDIPAGRCIAIVGTSGSGKSTITSLLLKLYSTGHLDNFEFPSITFDHRNIQHIHTPTLRSLMTIVPQTPTLFPATVAENITYGLPVGSVLARPENVHKAAIATGISEFILSLPKGYDTLIGEGGLGISGGQAQRIAIARALVRKPNVLILDEATSALDAESANTIRTTIIELLLDDRYRVRDDLQPWYSPHDYRRPPLTVIIITHSKAMMNFADQVVMLHRGEIVDKGTYTELVAKADGPFAKMMRGEEFAKEVADAKRRSWMAMNAAPGVVSGPSSWLNPWSESPKPMRQRKKQTVRDV